VDAKLDDSVAERGHERLELRVHAELREDVRDVVALRVERDEQVDDLAERP
jgi:hypothetical protein